MKPGKYFVFFEVDFDSEGSHDEATQAVKDMCLEMLQKDEFPEVKFDLIEEIDPEYNTEEDELEELNFEEAV